MAVPEGEAETRGDNEVRIGEEEATAAPRRWMMRPRDTDAKVCTALSEDSPPASLEVALQLRQSGTRLLELAALEWPSGLRFGARLIRKKCIEIGRLCGFRPAERRGFRSGLM